MNIESFVVYVWMVELVVKYVSFVLFFCLIDLDILKKDVFIVYDYRVFVILGDWWIVCCERGVRLE